MNRKFLTLKMKVRQFGITSLTIGGALFINKTPFSTFFLVIGALLFVFYYFLSSFNEIKKDPNWEIVFPELALGIEGSEKVKYEQYISGKERISYRLFYISKSIFIIAMSLKFFILSSPKIHLPELTLVTNLSLMISVMILASFYILSAFAPIRPINNWELVFPELREKKSKK